jgi:4-amino-4-deoxy-L-arabinose transferase-like glycosyltransferase
LLAVSLATAGIAQTLLVLAIKQPGFWEINKWLSGLEQPSPLPGLLLYVVSSWGFIQALILGGKTIPASLPISPLNIKSTVPSFGFWFTSLGMAVFLAYSLATPAINIPTMAVTITWLANIAIMTLSVLYEANSKLPSFKRVHEWFHSHKLELTGVTILTLAAFAIRFWNLELHPYAFMNDEAEMAGGGICILQGTCTNPFSIVWAGQPALAFLPTSISIALFGHTAVAVRLVSAVTGTLAVAAVYLVAREAFGQKEAWLAVALLAALPVHIHFSRLGVDNIIDSLSTTVILGLLFFGIKRNSSVSFLLAGIAGGLCMYTYPGSRLAPILGLVFLTYIALTRPGFLDIHLKNILILVIALLVTVAPLAGYFLANPDIFFARMQGEGIFQNQIITSENAGSILIDQFMKSSLVYILSPAPINFFNSPKPYLSSFVSVFFILGLAYILWRIKEERYLILFIWFWAEILLGSTLTGGPPTSQRMLMSMPALAIIISIGFCKTIENIPQPNLKFAGWQSVFLLVLFAGLTGYTNIRFYHYEYRIGHYFEDPSNEFSYEAATAISRLQDLDHLYLIVDPAINYLEFASFNYFSPNIEKSYFEVSLQSLIGLPRNQNILFIATPDRLDDLQKITFWIPVGEWTRIERRYQPGAILYYSYYIRQRNFQGSKP